MDYRSALGSKDLLFVPLTLGLYVALRNVNKESHAVRDCVRVPSELVERAQNLAKALESQENEGISHFPDESTIGRLGSEFQSSIKQEERPKSVDLYCNGQTHAFPDRTEDRDFTRCTRLPGMFSWGDLGMPGVFCTS